MIWVVHLPGQPDTLRGGSAGDRQEEDGGVIRHPMRPGPEDHGLICVDVRGWIAQAAHTTCLGLPALVDTSLSRRVEKANRQQPGPDLAREAMRGARASEGTLIE